jgi:transmembrane sensor
MQQEQAKKLLKKYIDGKATEQEKALLEAWYLQFEIKELPQPDELLKQGQLDRVRLAILEHSNTNTGVKVRRLWPRIAAAASIILCLGFGGYFLFHKTSTPQLTAQNAKQDIAPGGNKATLTLSNGKQIILTGAKNGKLAEQGNATINKTADGEVVYTNQASSPLERAGSEAYNTVSTPRAGQYHLKMEDGTNAWLNAESSIKYPVSFTGKDRVVEITGEVYFEVAHNAQKPFRVISKGQTVEVLGTHFNINAYDDEPNIKTTLLEGSVKVNNQVTLKPGQQAVLHNNTIDVKQVDAEAAIAWKNGLFSFKNTPMAEAMRQLSRWYDVGVEYPGGMPKTAFTGDMHRNVNASQVLDMLSFFKVNFQIVQGSNGKKIIVKP